MKNKFNGGIIVLICLIVFGIGFSIVKIAAPNFRLFNNSGNSPSISFNVSTSDDFDEAAAKAYKNEYIAAVYIEGTISESNYDYDQKWLLNTISKLKNDNKNVGMALFINSPGGAVYQADEAYFALQDYKASTGRPIYVYQGALAASGGYYLSCAGNTIYANRNTMTGCIGVLMGTTYDLTGLFDKVGIKSVTVHSGRNKNMMNYNEPFNEEQQAIMQSMCDECYEQFVSIVANSRHMDYNDAVELSDGRLYTAKQALKNGLIDKIDTWDNMLLDFSEELNKPGIKVVKYQKEKRKQSIFDMAIGKAKDIETAKTASALGLPVSVIEDMNNRNMMPMYLAPLGN